MSLRIIFMGTPEFAVASLEKLLAHNYNVVAVVTAPDRPAGRGQQLHESAVKKYALSKNIKILQPTNLKDDQFLSELRALNAELQLVVAFRMLPRAVWSMPKLGTYNLHASLLPKYRGAAPINWAIINGEHKTGITTFKIEQEIDAGTILFQEEVPIGPQTNAGELHEVLKEKGAVLLVKTVEAILISKNNKENLNLIAQNNKEVTHAPKLFRETCKINWNNGAHSIHNLIRGLSPYPAAHTQLVMGNSEKKSLKIYRSEFILKAHNNTNGSLVTDGVNSLGIHCSDGIVKVMELQLEGKKRMSTKEFLNGIALNSGNYVI